MVIAITPGETWDFIIESERELPAEEQTTWILRALGYTENNRIQDNALKQELGDDGGVQLRAGSYMDKVIRAGLVGWKNFKDADGILVEFETEISGSERRKKRKEPTIDTLDRIPPEVLTDLANAIVRHNVLDASAEKN